MWNDVAGALQNDGVADADILAGDFVLVMQTGAADHHPADGHGLKIGHGRHYIDVPPVKGVYRGLASATLEASVEMTRLDGVDPASIARA